MKKTNPMIKLDITLIDKINAVECIVASYFTNGEYTPYYAEMAETIAIVTYFIEGIEFDKDESIYDAVITDEEIMNLIKHVSDSDDMKFVKSMIKDKVNFFKELFANKKMGTKLN